jgi:two-component system, cell cycle response regulator
MDSARNTTDPPRLQTSAEREEARFLLSQAELTRAPAVRRAVLIGLVWLVAYAIATVVVPDEGLASKLFGNGAYHVPIVAAAVLTLRAAMHNHGRTRAFWLLMSAGCASWGLGELTWAVIVLRGEDGFPTVADPFFLGEYVFFAAGVVVRFGDDLRIRTGRSLLDALLVLLPLAYAAHRFVLAPSAADGATLATVVGLGYPIGDLLVVTAMVGLAFGGHRRVPRSVGTVAASMLTLAFADGVYINLELAGLYVETGWLDWVWQLAAVLMGIAAVMAGGYEDGEPQLRFLARDIVLPPVLLGLAGTLALLVTDAARQEHVLATAAVTVVVVAALVLRLFLTSTEKDRIALALREALADQERLAITDALTGLHNRRFFEEILRMEADRATRTGRPLGLLVIDLDHFKQVNDRHGHQVGDRVLKEAAARLLNAARTSDVVARYGGEEFLVLLPGTDADVLAEVAERIRRAIGDTAIGDVNQTTSVGAAVMPRHGHDAAELLRVADAALYRAKELGRDRVQLGPDERAAHAPREADTTLQEARIAAVCAAWTDLRAGGRDHPGLDLAAARRELRTRAETELDPAAVAGFLELLDRAPAALR